MSRASVPIGREVSTPIVSRFGFERIENQEKATELSLASVTSRIFAQRCETMVDGRFTP